MIRSRITLGIILALCSVHAQAWVHGGGGAPPVVPTVTSVLPNSGGTAGGTPVTITGTAFTGATAVKFSGVNATSVVVVSGTRITAVSPAGSAGTTNVRVTTPSGTSPNTGADDFVYADWVVSLIANGYQDINSVLIRGTELRSIVQHVIPVNDKIPQSGTTGNEVTCNSSWAQWNGTGCPMLFAGNGFWEDSSCGASPGVTRPPQVLTLVTPTGSWNQDHLLSDAGSKCYYTPGGITSPFIVANSLFNLTFTTDSVGSITPVQVITAAGLGGQIDTRNDATGTWTTGTPGGCSGSTDRGIGSHVDQSNSIEYMLIGNSGTGICHGTLNHGSFGFTYGSTIEPWYPDGVTLCAAGTLDACTNQNSDWGGSPTLNSPCNTVVPCNFSPRITSIVECTDSTGTLYAYAAIGGEVWQRIDSGTTSKWKLNSVMPNAYVGNASETLLRGLTCIDNPSGAGHVLLATTEGGLATSVATRTANVWRIDPAVGTGAGSSSGWFAETNTSGTPSGLETTFNNQWGVPNNSSYAGYMIHSYNDMTFINNSVVFGFGTSFMFTAPTGHTLFTVNTGPGTTATLNWIGGFWVRDTVSVGTPTNPVITMCPDTTGKYASLKALFSKELIAARAVVPSPFPTDINLATGKPQFMYFGGMDANKTPMTQTAWIVRSPFMCTIP